MSKTQNELKSLTKAELIAELQKPKPNPWLVGFYNFSLKAAKFGSALGGSLIALQLVYSLAKNNPGLLKKVMLGLWESTQSLVQGGSLGFAMKFLNSLGVWDKLEEYTGEAIHPVMKEAATTILLNLAPGVPNIKPILPLTEDIQMEDMDNVDMGSGNSPGVINTGENPPVTIIIPKTTSPLVQNAMDTDTFQPIVSPKRPPKRPRPSHTSHKKPKRPKHK